MYSPVVLKNLTDLKSAFPDAETTCLVRFAKNKGADSSTPLEMFTNYLAWRETFPRMNDHEVRLDEE